MLDSDQAGATRPGIVDAVADIAVSVSSSLDLHAVLNEVVRRALNLLGADRATILLLDADGRLLPAASAARRDDPAMWSRFREMEPISLPVLPVAEEAFESGRAVVIEDVAASPLVPEAVKQAFRLASLAVAPLAAAGERCGILVVDHGATPHLFSEDEVALLEAVAASAATGVRNARTHADALRRAADLERTVEVAAALNAAPSLHLVLQTAMQAVVAILDGDSCSVNVIEDAERARTLASNGTGQPEPGVQRLGALDAEERERIRRVWLRDPRRPLVYDGDRRLTLLADCPQLRRLGSLVLVPFGSDGAIRGFLLVGRSRGGSPQPAQFRLAVEIAGQVWLAIERARRNEDAARRLHHLEILYRLTDEVAVAPDMRIVLERLAPSVRAATDAELIDAFLVDPRASRLFLTPPPQEPVAGLLREWRRRKVVRPEMLEGLLLVPMRVDEQLVGVLRARPVGRPQLGTDEEELLVAIATGVGGVVGRAVLRAEIAEGERALAIAGERERIARDLHDTLGQMLFAIGLRVAESASDAEDPDLRRRLTEIQGAVAGANAEVRQAIHALSFLERGGQDLVRSLRALARRTSAASAFHVDFKVSGAAARLSPGKEEALYRVAHEALTNVEKHARASTVAVRLVFEEDGIELSVRDDGVGMALRPGNEEGLHFGLRTMRRRMSEVGGRLTVEAARPTGVQLTAWVPES